MIQSDLIDALTNLVTRLVTPLLPLGDAGRDLCSPNPEMTISDDRLTLWLSSRNAWARSRTGALLLGV